MDRPNPVWYNPVSMSEKSNREIESGYESLLREELQRLVTQLKRMGAEKIILFGSLAKGAVNIFSDLDLIVVIDSQADFVERHGHIYQALCPTVDADILVYTPEEFARMQDRPFIQQALKEGIVLYAKDAERGRVEMAGTG